MKLAALIDNWSGYCCRCCCGQVTKSNRRHLLNIINGANCAEINQSNHQSDWRALPRYVATHPHLHTYMNKYYMPVCISFHEISLNVHICEIVTVFVCLSLWSARVEWSIRANGRRYCVVSALANMAYERLVCRMAAFVTANCVLLK